MGHHAFTIVSVHSKKKIQVDDNNNKSTKTSSIDGKSVQFIKSLATILCKERIVAK